MFVIGSCLDESVWLRIRGKPKITAALLKWRQSFTFILKVWAQKSEGKVHVCWNWGQRHKLAAVRDNCDRFWQGRCGNIEQAMLVEKFSREATIFSMFRKVPLIHHLHTVSGTWGPRACLEIMENQNHAGKSFVCLFSDVPRTSSMVFQVRAKVGSPVAGPWLKPVGRNAALPSRLEGQKSCVHLLRQISVSLNPEMSACREHVCTLAAHFNKILPFISSCWFGGSQDFRKRTINTPINCKSNRLSESEDQSQFLWTSNNKCSCSCVCFGHDSLEIWSCALTQLAPKSTFWQWTVKKAYLTMDWHRCSKYMQASWAYSEAKPLRMDLLPVVVVEETRNLLFGFDLGKRQMVGTCLNQHTWQGLCLAFCTLGPIRSQRKSPGEAAASCCKEISNMSELLKI